MSEDDRYPVEAPGWAAIDRALGRVHPGVVPHQYASRTAYDLEGTAPLPAVAVYEGRGPAHWHYVSYGLSELFEKSSPRADVSGFGFELTLRLPREEGESEPPGWPIRLLQGIGHYVLSGHGELDSGHVIDLGGALVPGDRSTLLRGVVCIPDPTLGKIATPHGSLLFLQLYGLAEPEIEVMQQWELGRKVGLVLSASPLAITEPGRALLAEDPKTAFAYRRYALGILVDA